MCVMCMLDGGNETVFNFLPMKDRPVELGRRTMQDAAYKMLING